MGEVITKFKLETTQYDSKLRDATDRMKELMQSVQKAGGSMSNLSAKDRELASSFGTLSTGATNAKDKVRELTNDFNKMARQYNAMTAEMQKSDMGKMIAGQMQVMKDRLAEAKKELYEVGDAGKAAASGSLDLDSVLQSLGGQLGINTNLLSGLTTGTLATTAAVTAGVTAVAAATKAWADYNDEMNRQNTMTSVVTGLNGNDGEELTVGVRALARTYDVDFRQAIEAANTLIQQFGVSGEQALTLLQDGMQGMLAGDGGKLLQMIQQYAPSFRDAGISASQLVAIIHNSEGGLFTDQNMNAIVMGIRNIRLMTKNTSDALKQLGIDGEEMTRKLNDGSMTVFDALRQVSDKIDEVGSGSKAAGEVMQAVFGRQGTMAGTKLGEAIATLNLNLEETRTQTGELGASFAVLQDANRRLDTAMQGLLGNTVGWDEMNNGIKSGLLNSLAAVIEDVNTLKTAIDGLDASSDSFKNMADAIDNTIVSKLSTAVFLASQLRKLINGMKGDGNKQGGESSGGGKGFWSKGTSTPKDGSYWEKTDSNGNIIAAGVWKGGKQYQTTGAEVVVTPETNPPKTKTKSGRTSSKKSAPKWSAIEVGEMAGLDIATLGRSYADINKDLTVAKKQYEEAGDMFGRAAAAKLIEELGIEKTSMKAMEDPMAEANKHNFQQDLNKYNKSQKKDEKKDEKKEVSLLKEIGNMAGGIDQVVGGLESLGVELPRGLKDVVGGIQTMITIVTGISSVVTAIAAIAAADALKPFAGGGIVHAAGGYVVPGNKFSGDLIPAALSSGELVLNKAQQGVLAAELTGGSMRNIRLETYVSGRELAIVLNNDTESHGKGRYVVSNRRTT